MQGLFNNGYVVKGLFDNEYSSSLPHYRGVEKFVSWPLDDYDDFLSKKLQDEAWDKWFGYQNVLELVPERDYLQRYINHCKELDIDTTIIQIETPNNNQLAVEQLKIVDVLGFEYIAGVQYSYMHLKPKYMEEKFSETVRKLNTNILCNTLDDIYEFIGKYNQLLRCGENLECLDNPVPAYLSIVKLD